MRFLVSFNMAASIRTNDYRNILDFLEYPYNKLTDIVTEVDSLFAERGDAWLLELQALLDSMPEIKVRLDEESVKPQYKILDIDNEARAEMATTPIQAIKSEWNQAIFKLVKLTNIPIFLWQAEAYK
jgi:hypothetical protein